MHGVRRFSLKMIAIEIEYLRENVDFLIDEYNRFHNSEKLSACVFSDTLIVTRREPLGIDSFFRILGRNDPDVFASHLCTRGGRG
jgi:hypothetical protein